MSFRPTDAGMFAERLYAQMEPYSADDATNDWALLSFLGTQSALSEEIDEYASDGPNGEAGWSIVVDLDRAPTKALPWLGQFIGVSVDATLDDASQRQQIRDTGGWQRGSPGALAAAPLPYLTGSKTVVFRERDPAACPSFPAYGLTVITYTSETPDSSKVLAALLTQKPAGIVLNYVVRSGQDYQSLYNNFATYQDIYNNYLTYQGVMDDAPGT